MYSPNLPVIAFAVGIAIGLLIGLYTAWDAHWGSVLFDRSEAEKLWDILENEHPDLDVCSGRDTDNPRWVCYHPTRYADYNPHGFDSAKDALRDFATRATPIKKDIPSSTPELSMGRLLGET